MQSEAQNSLPCTIQVKSNGQLPPRPLYAQPYTREPNTAQGVSVHKAPPIGATIACSAFLATRVATVKTYFRVAQTAQSHSQAWRSLPNSFRRRRPLDNCQLQILGWSFPDVTGVAVCVCHGSADSRLTAPLVLRTLQFIAVPTKAQCLSLSRVSSIPLTSSDQFIQVPTSELHATRSVLLEKLTANSASQKIPLLLWNWQVHYHIPKSPPPVSIQRQMNPINPFQLYFPNVYQYYSPIYV